MRSFFVFVALSILAQSAGAQTVSGVITGTVKDPTDAVVVNAGLTLTNDATGAHRTAVTNEVGLYTFNAVQPGAYTLQVEQSGFKTVRRTNIVSPPRSRTF